jgi:hypothetical protein
VADEVADGVVPSTAEAVADDDSGPLAEDPLPQPEANATSAISAPPVTPIRRPRGPCSATDRPPSNISHPSAWAELAVLTVLHLPVPGRPDYRHHGAAS